MWLLLVPILLLLVVMFAVGSLFAGVFWLVGSTWPWLLIAAGAWMFWHQDGRHYRRRQARAAWVATGSAPPKSKPSSGKKSSAPPPLRPNELPIDLQVKVEQIRRKVDVLLGYADRFPPFSQDLYLVRQTASDYLPWTINAYLATPTDAVDTPMPTNGGKTPRQELTSQLDLLDRKLDDIAQDLQRQDADRLVANRRFLEQRFGGRETAATGAGEAVRIPVTETPLEIPAS
ncbi:MAG: hypothetical protein JO057_00320 [Chloroflexi bacterium]|nr:hypothetical protein [Chloroflexota bacterium]